MPPRMGRPPLNVKSTHIRLGTEVFERIGRLLRPNEKMVDLIRAAIEQELQRREAESKKKPGRK
jgi:hypothetical protein